MSPQNPLKHLSERAKKVFQEADTLARFHASPAILPIHLLTSIYFERGSVGSAFLKKIGCIDPDFATPLVPHTIKDSSKTRALLQLSEPLKKIIVKAYALAQSTRSPYVGTEHLVHATLGSKDADIQKLLEVIAKRSSSASVQMPAENSFPEENLPFSHFLNLPELNLLRHSLSEQQEDASAIDQFCIDLRESLQSESNDLYIGREKELEKLIHILGRKKKNNALLLGDPGVGKTSLVSGLMRKILAGTVPESLRNTVIYELDLASVVAGTSFRGEFEERLKAIVEEAEEDPNVLLFIDEIHTLVGAGNSNGALDAANILKPALARGTLRCIGATTREEYKKYFEKDGALNRRFQAVLVEEPSPKETEKILLGILPSFETFHHVSINHDAVHAAVSLGERFLPARFFPDKAIDIIDSACSARRSQEPPHKLDLSLRSTEEKLRLLSEEKQKALEQERYDVAEKIQREEITLQTELTRLKTEKAKKNPRVSVTRQDVERAVSQNTNLPLDTIQSSTIGRLRALQKQLAQKIVGQEKAIAKILKTLTRSSVGLSRSARPIGSFLLLGPTGVGKTFTAKLIAHHFFEKKNSFIRVDMSEFRERHTVSGLLGAPAGYVGYGEGGTFTEKVRKNPHSLILFDEVEKAHPDILNILLQILEEGELTDAEGRKISFTDTIVILTANIGSHNLFNAPAFGFGSNSRDAFDPSAFRAIRSRLLAELPQHIRPEILARLDEILVLEPLAQQDIRKIVITELSHIKKTLAKKHITFAYNTKSIALLTQKSLKKGQGARLVRKTVQTLVEGEIAEILLQEKTPSAVKMTADTKNHLVFTTAFSKK